MIFAIQNFNNVELILLSNFIEKNRNLKFKQITLSDWQLSQYWKSDNITESKIKRNRKATSFDIWDVNTEVEGFLDKVNFNHPICF